MITLTQHTMHGRRVFVIRFLKVSFSIKLAAVQARGDAHMKLQGMNDELWMSLRSAIFNNLNKKNSLIRHSSIDICHAGVSFSINWPFLRPTAWLTPEH
jgi:hypothetical protein